MPLRQQIFAFGVLILTGLASGFCYDVYLVIKYRWKLKKTGTSIGDLLFWTVLTALIFSLLVVSNYGEIRFYVIIALGLGLMIYFKLLSKSMLCCLQKFFDLIQKLWRLMVKTVAFLCRLILFPLHIIITVVCYPFLIIKKVYCLLSSWLYVFMKNILRRPCKSIKFRVKNIIRRIRKKPK